MMKIILILLMMMAASVRSLTIKNGLSNTCLAYQRDVGQQATGQFIISKPCNSADIHQNNWIVNTATSSGGSPTSQWCVNGTNFCVGFERSSVAYKRSQPRNINLKLVANDPSDESQQWFVLDTQTLSNHYINGLTGGCVQARTASNRDGPVKTLRCTAIAAQQWTINS
jgi:hypothetical protein